MSQIASKNLYDLLGNDPELDPDREPEPPTKVIDKPVQRSGKRNAGAEGPGAGTARSGRAATFVRGDEAGSLNNRAEQRDDGLRQDRHANRTREPREGGYRGRGTRGGPRGGGGRTFRSGREDRQSHSGIGDHEKQAAHGWGAATDGNAEYSDEKAGEAIANAEAKNESGVAADVNAGDPALADGPDGEVSGDAVAVEEDNTKSYDQYLAEQAEKRLALGGGGSLEARRANEGSKQTFPDAPAFARNPEEENFFVGGAGKARREKNQKAKDLFTLDGNYYAAPEAGDRGGRGRGRGGRGGGRGEFRGDRGDRGGRGGRGRGEFRGGRGDRAERGGASRGAPRGGLNPADQSAFPALGGS